MTVMAGSTAGLTIDLGAIRQNWQVLAQKVGVQTSVAAVVKANAYGLGAESVAPALFAEGCREFYVATLEEAQSLRQLLGFDAKIYVLGGADSGDEAAFISLQLIPVLSTLAAVRRWADFLVTESVTAPSVLKMDSGMTRLGLSRVDIDVLLACDGLLTSVQPIIFMSHLACADDSSRSQNAAQLHCFTQAAQKIKAILPAVRLSFSSSSGIYLGEEYHQDQVRAGAALYGLNPVINSDSSQNNPVSEVVSLRLPVLQYRCLSEGSAVGYGADYFAAAGSKLAVVRGGYADGLHRTLAGRKFGFMAGQQVPVVGRISMDLTVFDVSAVPLSQLESSEGNYIEVLGVAFNVNQSRLCGDYLGYEILTSLGARYVRHYLGGE